MVLMRSFCVIFTIRLGSIIIGVGYLIESLVCFALSVSWMSADPARTSEVLKDILDENDFLYFSDLLHRVSKDPSPFKELFLCISCLRLVGCTLLIYGAYYMKPLSILPFLSVELIHLCSLLFLHITAMQVVKENTQDLGLLIGATLAGSFILLFLFYTWACVYSLFWVLWSLRSVDHQKTNNRLLPALGPVEFPPKLYPAYAVGSYMAPIY